MEVDNMEIDLLTYFEYTIMILSIFLMGLSVCSRSMYALALSIIGSLIFLQKISVTKIFQMWIILWSATYTLPKIEEYVQSKINKDEYPIRRKRK
jgi:hypothetical protein